MLNALRRGHIVDVSSCLLALALALPVAAADRAPMAAVDVRSRDGRLTEAALLGRGDGGIEGLALVRPVLQGVLYRAGFKGGDRTHAGLSGAQRGELCTAGFSGARYIDFGAATHFDTTSCPRGSFEYAKGSTARPAELMRQIHDVIEDPSRGPILLHCMWGVHSSGAIAAMALVQFCGWTETRAKAYWNDARNNAPCAGGCDKWIDGHFARFAVDPALVPGAAAQALICPGAHAPEARASGEIPGAGTGGLAGTQWALESIQSMDDAIGTLRVAEPAQYTLRLGADGAAYFRLNCNRANGSWQSRVAADGVSGSIGFGPLAGTRALCPPPSLDERILNDMQWVRGFLLRDGRLHLSLQADGGIYTWRSAAPGLTP